MLIDHGNSTEHRADDTEKALVSAGQKEILVTNYAIFYLFGSTINGPFFFASVTLNSQRSKGVFIEYMRTELTNNLLNSLS